MGDPSSSYKNLFLRNWQSGPIEKLSLKKILVWIKLWGIPLELFTPEEITCIASAVGKPMNLDKATEENRRISFARVCIEANREENLPQGIELEIEGVGLISIYVEYPRASKFCSICKAHDHEKDFCKWH